MGKKGSVQTTNIRFNLEDERQRYAWQLLQDRDKEQYSSYSQAVISALIELLKEPETDYQSPEMILNEVYIPQICRTVEETVERAIEKMLPAFLAGYMSCMGSIGHVKDNALRLPRSIETKEEPDPADTDIDFSFLGLE